MTPKMNSPARVLRNLDKAPARMVQVAEAVGRDQVVLFSESLARLADHMQASAGSLVGNIGEKQSAAQVVMHLVSAATEFETGWNTLCLANIPAAHRQSRVATECVAHAVMLSLPTDKLLTLPSRLSLVKCLGEHSPKSLLDLTRPSTKRMGKQVQKVEAIVRGPAVMEAFLRAAQDLLRVPPKRIDELRTYRNFVQNPSSHGSVETNLYHFENFDGGPAGALFRPDRIDSYRYEAEQITNLVHLCSDLLDAASRYLASNRAAANPGPQPDVTAGAVPHG